jgi:hypothetical protein
VFAATVYEPGFLCVRGTCYCVRRREPELAITKPHWRTGVPSECQRQRKPGPDRALEPDYVAYLYAVDTVHVPTPLDVCQQPTRTQNSVTTDIQFPIYPDTFQRITASSSEGACFKNTKTPLKTLEGLKTRSTVL